MLVCSVHEVLQYMALTPEEKRRYARHLNLPQFGEQAQEKLKAAKVLVVGTGGLGAPILQYLVAAGVGTIGVVDFDTVAESNLQRQVLFDTKDIGKPKTSAAIDRLQHQNPLVHLVDHREKIDASNAMEIIAQYDVVADGTDNFPTRYLINDACVLLGIPYVYASIHQFEGQVSVFGYGSGPNYRDLFPAPPPPGMVPSCAEGGVLGVLPGIIGSMQASEVLKIVSGVGDVLSGKLFLFDALSFTTKTVNIRKDPENPISGHHPTISALIDYDEFCGVGKGSASVTVRDLQRLRKEEEHFVLIDVRERQEYELSNIGGSNIPLGNIEEHLGRIPKQGKVIVHCKSGARSEAAISLLANKHGYTNLMNLEGGILAWQNEVDPALKVF